MKKAKRELDALGYQKRKEEEESEFSQNSEKVGLTSKIEIGVKDLMEFVLEIGGVRNFIIPILYIFPYSSLTLPLRPFSSRSLVRSLCSLYRSLEFLFPQQIFLLPQQKRVRSKQLSKPTKKTSKTTKI